MRSEEYKERSFIFRVYRSIRAGGLIALGIAILACLLFSCTEIWGKWDNPVDPEAIKYIIPSPYDGEAVEDSTPLLNWVDISNADSYEIQLSKTSEGLSSVKSIPVTISQYQTGTALSFGDWYWRLRAKRADGTFGAWSNVWHFNVAWIYSTQPKPTSRSGIAEKAPLLNWDDIVAAVSYEIQISKTKEGLSTVAAVSVNSSEYQVASNLSFGTWYWRIRPKNLDGFFGDWSDSWSFAVGLLDLEYVSGGTFSMGSTSGYTNETPIHQVTLSTMLMGKHEVTQELFQQLIGMNPSYFSTGSDAAKQPVECVSWYDAVEFCNKLSDFEGYSRVYTITNRTPSSGYPITNAIVTMDMNRNGYRLPTEAEWEFVAKGGTASNGYTYAGSNDANLIGWCTDNSASTSHKVGTKAANELGIYDMSGNVFEWCWDWYSSYGSAAQNDPTGTSTSSYRVIRGGSWNSAASLLRPSYRSYNSNGPGAKYTDLGFRVLRRP